MIRILLMFLLMLVKNLVSFNDKIWRELVRLLRVEMIRGVEVRLFVLMDLDRF